MYQSLYREHRPKTFNEIVGQDAIAATLKNQIVSGKIAHAYLFCGTRGTGKTSAARIMASAVNCLNSKDGNPCLGCEACLAIQSEMSLDVFEMDAASNSKVEEIRDMLEKVPYPPQFSKYKVYIIDEVHMLSNAAFNALLKTLEEPPSYMIFILATTEPQKLPATILSRCQRFDFARISEDNIISRLKIALKDDSKYELSALQLLAAAAEGSMRDAWSLMEVCLNSNGELYEDGVRLALGTVTKDFLCDYTRALINKDSKKAQHFVDGIIESGKDAQVFLRDYARLIKNLIALKLGGVSSDYFSKNETLIALANDANLDWLILCLDSCVKSEAEAKWAFSPNTSLLLFTLKACSLPDESSIIALSERITELEDKIKNGGIGFNSYNNRQSSKDPNESKEPTEIRTFEEKATAADSGVYQAVENTKSSEEEFTKKKIDEVSEEINKGDPPVQHTDNVEEAWNKMLRIIKSDHPPYFSLLSSGKYGGFKNNTFYIEFNRANEFKLKSLMQEEKRSTVKDVLGRLLGYEVNFEARFERTENLEDTEDKDLKFLSALFGRDKIIVKD